MAEWNEEYINPYAEHGKKSEQVKKITVSKELVDKSTIYVMPLTVSCYAKLSYMPLQDNPCLTMQI